MKQELEEIIANAKELIELAECDIDCFGDDFSADGYRKRISAIEDELGKVDPTSKKKPMTEREMKDAFIKYANGIGEQPGEFFRGAMVAIEWLHGSN